MPNTHSKPAAAGDKHEVLEDKERTQKLENEIVRLQELLRDWKKKYNDLRNQLQRGGPVEEAPEHQIQQLTTQLEEAEITNKKLKDENQKLKNEKFLAEVSKAELEEQMKKEIEKLKSKLDDTHRKYLEYRRKARKLCDEDCVVWSLVWICRHKLNEHLCGRQLEKMITTHAERKHGITITNKDLRCEYFMRILEKCGIASEAFPTTELGPKIIDNEYRDGQIDKVWQELLGVDAKNLVVMVLTERSREERSREERSREERSREERSREDREGHCIVCDLKRSNEGSFECHDLQRDLRMTVTEKEQVKEYVKDDERIALYSVDIEYLRKIINCHKDKLTGFGCDCEREMLPAPPVDTEQVASPALDLLDETVSTCD